MQPEVESVRSTNQRFYDALSSQNLLVMEAIWSHAPHVRCVHPGWNMLVGWEAIRDSWRSIFTQALCLTVEALDPQVTVLGPTAIVTCREKITSFTLEGSTMASAEAANIFEKRAGRWQLIHHHASPILSAEEAGESE
jgi:ketosteroid isomerase-like protein